MFHDALVPFAERWIITMKNVWNEYGGVVLGVTGIVAITGIVMRLLLPAGEIYKVILAFSQSIC